MTITVSTDGSALGNPNGPMGWAWADHEPGRAHTPGHDHDGDCDAGGATNGTNQIGELCAVLEALRAHPGTEELLIETDSQYAINCSTKWVHGWKKNGWRNTQKKPVKNAPLIKAIDEEITRRPGRVRFHWVKGHAGNAGNEKVDDLAHTYSGDARSGVRDGYLPLEGWQSLLASSYAKGVDIPSDAQLLMDGTISSRQYHLGRGSSSASVDDANTNDAEIGHGDVGHHQHDKHVGRPSSRPTLDQTTDDHSASSHLPLVQRLSEPESVPDIAGDGPDDRHEKSHDGHHSDDVSTAEKPGTAPAIRPTGLHASGTLRLSPPPSSSPTYDGRPRRINGFIAVDGYVDGNGDIHIDHAPFGLMAPTPNAQSGQQRQ